jgi:hypothetical protein
MVGGGAVPLNATRKLKGQFPRTNVLPLQSSKFWAKEKDRYLRQLLISDIEEETGRELVVYFSQLSEGINPTDADDLSEIIEGCPTRDIDLPIQTPGGEVDAVEKFVSVLKNRLSSYRVIVPSWAKSGGTVIAMSSQEILLGVNSELGPIDPQMFLPDIGIVPCELVAKDRTKDPIIRGLADTTVKRMSRLAKKILQNGMLSSRTSKQIDRVITQIGSPSTYGSHGAVIDFDEAQALGLTVSWMEPENTLWKKVWLLYTLYDYDTKTKGLGRIVEGAINSIARELTIY